jgi:hypothetical protein
MSLPLTEALGITSGAALLGLGVFFVGGIVKGGLGFGLPLVTVSLLPLLVPIDLAFAINALLIPFVNVWQIRQAGRTAEALRRFWPLPVALCLTLPLSVRLGAGIDTGTLTLALGLVVMLFTVVQAFNPRLAIPARLERPGAALTGVAAGLVAGLTTINGPFFVLYLVGRATERPVMMGALGIFFLLTGALLALSFTALGRIDAARVIAAGLCLVPALAGQWLGNRLGARVPQALFRKVVLAGLFLAGANITLNGLAA